MVEKIFIRADQELPRRQAVGSISNWQCPRFWSQGERWDGGYGEVALRLVCSGTCLGFFYVAQQIRSQTCRIFDGSISTPRPGFSNLYYHIKRAINYLLSTAEPTRIMKMCK